MSFDFTTFKTLSGITDAEEPKYALVMRAIFESLELQYDIDMDTLTYVPYILQNAIYEHASFLYKVETKGLNLISSITDTSGNKTSYNVTTPKEILAIYKMLSPTAPALL